MRKPAAVVVSTLGVGAALVALAGPAQGAGPHAFTLHLECDNGQSYDISVNDPHSVAAHVVGSTSIAVLKGGNGTGVTAFLPGGPQAGRVVSCDTGIPGFSAIVLFTPAGG